MSYIGPFTNRKEMHQTTSQVTKPNPFQSPPQISMLTTKISEDPLKATSSTLIRKAPQANISSDSKESP